MKSPYGGVADAYLNRPSYPIELFEFIRDCSPRRGTVWDVGCGSGQASHHLAGFFDQVIASDTSVAQLERAKLHPRIRYEHWPAEHSGLKGNSVDCTCVFMAAHWFDLSKFYKETCRVSTADGVIAIVSYGEPVIDGDPIISDFLGDIACKISRFGGPAIQRMRDGYKNLPFPFPSEIAMPGMSTFKKLTGQQVVSYYRSRASVIDYCRRTGVDLGFELEQYLADHGRSDEIFDLRWPLAGRIARVHAKEASLACIHAGSVDQ